MSGRLRKFDLEQDTNFQFQWMQLERVQIVELLNEVLWVTRDNNFHACYRVCDDLSIHVPQSWVGVA
jgi:hypothetical protein